MGEFGAIGKIAPLHEGSGTHDLVVLRGGDHPLYRGLVRNVVHGGQPMAGSVRPVVPEEGPLPPFVGADDQAIGGCSLVGNGVGALVFGPGWRPKGNGQSVPGMGELDRFSLPGDTKDLHARLSPWHLPDEVQGEGLRAVFREKDGDIGPTEDLIGSVTEGEVESVVEDVDGPVPGILVGNGLGREGEEPACRQESGRGSAPYTSTPEAEGLV